MCAYPGMSARYLRGFEKEKILNTVKNRFYEKVRLPNENGCMEWVGKNGKAYSYGCFMAKDKKNTLAHRFSYELYVGKIPSGMLVLHKCDNPPCVNPDHLFIGSQKDNSLDMISKNRAHSNAHEKHGMAKLSHEDVKEIKRLYSGKWGEIAAIGRMFNVGRSQVCLIVHNKSWRNI